jgi:hypothetical protein
MNIALELLQGVVRIKLRIPVGWPRERCLRQRGSRHEYDDA